MKFYYLLPWLSLAACGGVSAQTGMPDQEWLLGRWLLVENGARSLAGCGSHLPLLISADGTYSVWEEEGTWTLKGDRLTTTATSANEDAQPVDVDIGRPFTNRIERIGDDEMRQTYEDGTRRTLLRCPDAE